MALEHGCMPAVLKTVPANVVSVGACAGHGGDGRLTIVIRQFQRITRALKVGARNDEFGASGLLGSLDDGVQVIGMSLSAVVLSPEDRVCQVDSNLLEDFGERVLYERVKGPLTSTYRSFEGAGAAAAAASGA
jgi:hypothetical protein